MRVFLAAVLVTLELCTLQSSKPLDAVSIILFDSCVLFVVKIQGTSTTTRRTAQHPGHRHPNSIRIDNHIRSRICALCVLATLSLSLALAFVFL